ncbi:putative 2-dehydropantoate 2-reductase [Crateriforma conspicua]|uniref:2-dehydropantoate 2-reductase n=1 Tax=Crateriforma conspicua TaxID=2527996 RepID=A0A5C5Y5H6_9PLAN|nr:putative 2-dehydropantoate 2-reductase [Crateriforma conspicua]QDV64781.1 2-dehydropantoate 2-reductase [Crateriforma conspicua]TWT70178.1 2-dehydropantoate 2-reductase [Crateriforma conspicua]
MQRYAIIGSGALGGLYGARLAAAGHEVHFLFRSDYQHVRQHGLKVDSVWGDLHLHDVNAYQCADDMPPCDVTIVALKTTQNHHLPKLLAGPTAGGGAVLVLQNGLDVEADSAQVVGVQRTLGGCCFLCSNKVGPGHIKHIDYGRIVFGEYSPQAGVSDRAARIASELNAAGVEAIATDDLLLTRWRKLMWNITFNGLSVVCDASTDQLMDGRWGEQLSLSLVREVHAAAAACGVSIAEDAIGTTIEHTRKMVPYDSSMRLDFLNGRPMEVEAIFGNPLRAAQAAGFDAPRIEMLYRQLKVLDQLRRGSQAASASSSAAT